MKLTFNGTDLTSLGVLEILGRSSRPTPAESPTYRLVTLRVRITATQPGFSDNFALLSSALSATGTVDGTLLWQDDRGLTLFTGPATVNEEDVGDTSPGTHRQSLSLAFTWQENTVTSTHPGLTVTLPGGATLNLGQVEKWDEDYQSSRFNEMRKHRRRTGSDILVSGVFLAPNPQASVSTQRTALFAALDAWRSALATHAEVTLARGTFNQAVRIKRFRPVVNDAKNRIHWTLEADFTLFPNEGDYAVCDVLVSPMENKEKGTVGLRFSGRISAQSESAALTKLSALRSTFIPGTHVREQESYGSQNVESADGATWIELTFEETYWKAASNVIEYEVRTAEDVDRATGLKRTVYSGSVRAHGSTASGAASTAIAKAVAVGAIGSGLRTGERSNCTTAIQKQTTGDVIVRCEFSFEYLSASGLEWRDYRYETVADSFGPSSIRLSGFVAAADASAAASSYATLRGTLTGLVLNETTGSPTLWSAGSSLSVRFDFSISVHLPKTSSQSAMRYYIESEVDAVGQTRRTTVSGEAVAIDKSTANTYVGALITALALGTPLKDRRREQRMKAADVAALQTDQFVSLGFDLSFETADTAGLDEDAIIQCDVTEEVEYSATRWVEQPIPDGASVMQNCGIETGSRRVSGTVRARSRAAALDWAYARRSFLTLVYERKPQIATSYEFAPLVSGIPTGGSANPRVIVVRFTFSEILVNYQLEAPPSTWDGVETWDLE